MRALVLLALTAMSLGCAHTRLKGDWATADDLKFDTKKHPEAAAVYLLRVEKTQLLYDNGWFTQTLRHEVIRVQKEAGFDLAEVKVPFWGNESILELKARVIQPDGTSEELQPRQMLSDTNGSGARDLNAKYFRFPDVRLGSVLEYVYVIERDSLTTDDVQKTVGYFPTERYQFELTAAKPIVLEAKEYNSTYPIDVRTLGDGRHQLSCELRDLPQRKKEDFAPDWTFVEPRWAWRAVAYRQGSLSYDWQRTWKDAASSWAKRVYANEGVFSKGFTLRVDASKTTDAPSKVAAALAVTREALRADQSAAWNRNNELKGVLESGRGSIFERAAVLERLITDQGLEAWLAFTADKHSAQQDPDFPQTDQFNHVLVWVPKQPGIEAQLWLDPHCEFCAVGQLTSRHRGVDALVFRAIPGFGSEPTVEADWRVAQGDDALSSAIHQHFALTVTPNGDAAFDEDTTAVGLNSADDVNNKLDSSTKAVADNMSARHRRIYPLSRDSRFEWGDCTHASGRCSWKTHSRFPRYAVPDGERLLVPMTLFHSRSGLFDDPNRTEDIHFTWDDTVESSVVDVVVPDGYALVDKPIDKTERFEGVSATLKLEKTPSGARVTQRWARPLATFNHNQYDEIRAVLDVFKRARQLVLTFEKKTPTP